MKDTVKLLLERPGLKPYVPDWVIGWVVPEYEDIGPENFNHSNLSPYCPSVGQLRSIRAADFFNHLVQTGIIKYCLSFQEGRSLMAKKEILSAHFRKVHICLWRSTAFDIFGNLFVPWIQNIQGQPAVIYWWWLEYQLYDSHKTFIIDQAIMPSFCMTD